MCSYLKQNFKENKTDENSFTTTATCLSIILFSISATELEIVNKDIHFILV